MSGRAASGRTLRRSRGSTWFAERTHHVRIEVELVDGAGQMFGKVNISLNKSLVDNELGTDVR